jgi:tetratricopeptide (TPR) repeat protein
MRIKTIAALGGGVLILVVAGGGAYRYRLSQEARRLETARPVPSFAPYVKPPRPWRWPTEGEWVVHEVVRSLVSWSALARGEDAAGSQVTVHRVVGSAEPGVFEVTVAGPRGTSKFNIQPATHVWDAATYVEPAKALLGSEEAPAGDAIPKVDTLLLAGDTASLRRADGLLFQPLSTRPRDANLHDQAALLFASHGLKEADRMYVDARPFLNGLVAHLALARALRGAAPPTLRDQVAAAAADTFVWRQTDAMASLDRIDAADPEGRWKPWTHALRLRITLDPRLASLERRPTGLEAFESARALQLSWNCEQGVKAATSWGLAKSAAWVRAAAESCPGPEFHELVGESLALQVEDAGRLLDLKAGPLDSTLDALQAASLANTHQPARPTSIVPAHVRADAGLRHIVAAWSMMVRALKALGRPDAVEELARETETARNRLPQRALLDMDIHTGLQRQPVQSFPAQLCAAYAELVTDHPDLIPDSAWGHGRLCLGQPQPPLRMVSEREWTSGLVVPGTGLLGAGPWRGVVAGKGPEMEAARRRAPWSSERVWRFLMATYGPMPPTAEVLKAYEKLLGYNATAINSAIATIHDAADDDTLQQLAERLCEVDVETCAKSAERLAQLGRDEAAERMWKRALADARGAIGLSNSLGWYVNLLLDRGEEREALGVAQSAAQVYSAAGLFTLGNANERLGRFRDAAREYAKITKRYENSVPENTFYVRYRQRHGTDMFRQESDRATAALFPGGLVRKTLADFRREAPRDFVELRQPGELDERFRRAGLHQGDFLAAVDGFAIENRDQMVAALSFTDEPTLTAIVMRPGSGFIEVSGPYRRRKYGPVPRRPPS